MEAVRRLSCANGGRGVVIFSKSTCCMCHTVKVLFQELGVEPIVHEMDHIPEGKNVENALKAILLANGSSSNALPVVFVGGAFVGSTNEVMSMHLTGSLLPMLNPHD